MWIRRIVEGLSGLPRRTMLMETYVEAIEVMAPRLEQADFPRMRAEVEVDGVAVHRDRLGLQRVLSAEPRVEVVTGGEGVDVNVRVEGADDLLQGRLCGGLGRELVLGREPALGRVSGRQWPRRCLGDLDWTAPAADIFDAGVMRPGR